MTSQDTEEDYRRTFESTLSYFLDCSEDTKANLKRYEDMLEAYIMAQSSATQVPTTSMKKE